MSSLPSTKDLNTTNITPNTIAHHSHGPNPRLTYILQRLITHLHTFALETRLTTSEWEAGINFLTETGRMCHSGRQEFILLSDVLGLSTLIEAINHPKPAPPSLSTEGTVLGPFHTHDAPPLPNGSTISSPESTSLGTPLLVTCRVLNTSIHPPIPIPNATITTWETDPSGHYDVQYPGRTTPDNRGILTSDAQGRFSFQCVLPVSYPIPHDGPVGTLLRAANRHPWRPAHIHFKIEAAGFDTLVTALYLRGDPYENSDAVFGVKSSLVVDIEEEEEEEEEHVGGAKRRRLRYDFGMVTEEDTTELRVRKAVEALAKLGSRAKIVEGLPVAEVD